MALNTFGEIVSASRILLASIRRKWLIKIAACCADVKIFILYGTPISFELKELEFGRLMPLIQPASHDLRRLLHLAKMRCGLLRVVLIPLAGVMTVFLLFNQFLFGDEEPESLFSIFETNATEKAQKVEKAFDEWNKCMVARFEKERKSLGKLWMNFHNLTNQCTAETEVSKIILTPFVNSDETKYYVLSENVSDPSVVVSLGIGADVTAELQLKDKLPQGSEFFGADPVIVPNSELFSRIGIFFPFAVSKESGVVKSEIRENDGSYKQMNAVSIDFVTFLNEMVNRTVIDHLIMDNEGPEYDLVPMIAIDRVIEDNGIVICHMNVEFHEPGPIERLQLFDNVISGILKARRFAPIYNFHWGHQRCFLINYEHPYCVEKYLAQFF
ncbi:hypothetical protein RB195_011093 [Necator americanus]|uniref:Methyltransferase FkbM domain-containing protein n=1 Tax=Necator americanus TaxID=51031 RepID=A0ABR1D0V8_NECAM